MIIFVASYVYASGLARGNVPWQQGELFGLEGVYMVTITCSDPSRSAHISRYSPSNPVRGIGTSLATATNWSANLVINSTYLSLIAQITTCIRILRGALSAGVRLSRVLFPGDGRVEFGKGEVGVRGWVWDSAEQAVEGGEASDGGVDGGGGGRRKRGREGSRRGKAQGMRRKYDYLWLL